MMVRTYRQTCVPLWFPAHFGEPYPPIASTVEALERFVAPAFAVGIRLQPDDTIGIAAPFGLADIFDMTLRPNPNRGLAEDWDGVVARAKARWPELKVVVP